MNLSNNKIRRLPENFGELKKLMTMDLSGEIFVLCVVGISYIAYRIFASSLTDKWRYSCVIIIVITLFIFVATATQFQLISSRKNKKQTISVKEL